MTNGWVDLDDYAEAGAYATVNIEVEADGTDNNDDDKITEAESNGGYVVTIKRLNGDTIVSKKIDNTKTGLAKTNQGTLGAYANVYAGRHMAATVTMSGLVQELAVEE